MDIYQLQVFLSVYRHKSFTAASEEMHITQPSISMHIKRLEDELGIKLFDRMGRKTSPTRQAELLQEKAEELMLKLKGIKEGFSGAEAEIEGLLTIGTSSSSGAYVLPYIAAEFRKLHPKVFFRLIVKNTGEIYEKIEKGEILIGVVDDKRERENLVFKHSIVDEMVMVTAPGYLKKKAITPLGIFRIPLLMREEESDARKSMEKQHLIHNIALKRLNVVAILGSTDALKEAVKAGLGAAILSRFSVNNEIKGGILEEVRIRGVRMRRTSYIVTHRNRSLPNLYQSFLDYLKENLPSV